jgi:hypothetical protein
VTDTRETAPRWPRQTAYWVLASALITGTGAQEERINRALRSTAAQIVAGVVAVDPTMVAEFFFLQAAECNVDLGFRCAPAGMPAGSLPSERPTLDPSDHDGRTRARAIGDALWPPSHWVTTIFSAPVISSETLRSACAPVC